MTWTEPQRGWLAAADEVLQAFAHDGFLECKREMTTSRRDLRPAGGIWQGVNSVTGSVASAIWVARGTHRLALVFIEIDGEVVDVWHGPRGSGGVAHTDEGGES